MENTEKIQRTLTRVKCGMSVVAACKEEGLSPPVLYRSPEWKAYKAEVEEVPASDLPKEIDEIEEVTPFIKIVRLPQTDDPRDPIFKVETRYAGDPTVGEHYFSTIQSLVAQLPQLAFGLTP